MLNTKLKQHELARALRLEQRLKDKSKDGLLEAVVLTILFLNRVGLREEFTDWSSGVLERYKTITRGGSLEQ